MMTELKPCPFCGQRPNILVELTQFKDHPLIYKVGCDYDRCFVNPCTPTSHIREHSIETWNSRAESEELKFTRQFIHEHGLEFELASAWNRRAEDGK